MKRLTLIFSLLVLLNPANITGASAATIDPFKGRWRVDMKRTMESFHKFAPQNIPAGGFPAAIIRSMKNMSLDIRSRRYVLRAGKRKIISSKFEIISLSDDGVMMRIFINKKIREQLLVLTPRDRLRVIAMNNGKPEPRASGNYFYWYRIKRTKRVRVPAAAKTEIKKVKK